MLTRLSQAASTLQSWQTSWDRWAPPPYPRARSHVQTRGRVPIVAGSVIPRLLLDEASVLAQDWRGASSPGAAQRVATAGQHRCTPSDSTSAPDHKSHRFIFTPHCAQTHIFHATYYASFRDAHALRLHRRLFCVCSVYKYGSETSIMAPASNKQSAEKPPIPAFP